jgi:hypothetical protein
MRERVGPVRRGFHSDSDVAEHPRRSRNDIERRFCGIVRHPDLAIDKCVRSFDSPSLLRVHGACPAIASNFHRFDAQVNHDPFASAAFHLKPCGTALGLDERQHHSDEPA